MSSDQDRTLLILDLDETLVHSSNESLACVADFRVGPYFVHRRPFLTEFLENCDKEYQIAVWSSASADYVAAIVDRVFPKTIDLTFVWARERCTRRYDQEFQEEYFLKNLKKVVRLGFDLNRVLIVEDEPRKVQNQYGNAIYVHPFVGSAADDELQSLTKYLASISSLTSLRRLEKRNWRNCIRS